MSIGSFIKSIFASSAVASAETFALNELDKGIAAAKKTPLGATVVSAVNAAEAVTGSEAKLAAALEVVGPAVVTYLASGGVTTVVADVEQFAIGLIESTLADIKVTKAVATAKSILKLLGITA